MHVKDTRTSALHCVTQVIAKHNTMMKMKTHYALLCKSTSIVLEPSLVQSTTGILASSDDPHEMLLTAAFYKGLHLLLRQSRSSEREIFLLKSITLKIYNKPS